VIDRRPALLAFTLSASLLAAPTPAAEPPAEAAPESVVRAAAEYTALERAEVARLSGLLDGLLADPAFIAPFQARNREALLAQAKPRFTRLMAAGVTHWYFLEGEPTRACFLRVHQPALFGDEVRRETLSRAIATQQVGAGKELGKTAFALRVVKPIRVAGAVVGYMELGEEIGDFLVKLRQQTGDDFGLLVDKRRIDRQLLAKVRGEDRWDERPDVVLIDSTFWNEALLSLPIPFERLPDQGVRAGEGTSAGGRFVDGVFPVRDAANQVVGALYVRHKLPK
jgi:hypothetical protein